MKAMIQKTTEYLRYFSPIFANCLFDEKERLFSLPMVGNREFGKNEKLFSAGERPIFIYRFIKGRARLSFYTGPNRRPVSRLIEVHEIIGLSEAILDLPFGADAATLDECTCEEIRCDGLREILQKQPGIGFRLARILSENVQTNYELRFFNKFSRL